MSFTDPLGLSPGEPIQEQRHTIDGGGGSGGGNSSAKGSKKASAAAGASLSQVPDVAATITPAPTISSPPEKSGFQKWSEVDKLPMPSADATLVQAASSGVYEMLDAAWITAQSFANTGGLAFGYYNDAVWNLDRSVANAKEITRAGAEVAAAVIPVGKVGRTVAKEVAENVGAKVGGEVAENAVKAGTNAFSLTKHGELTNGVYTVSKEAMKKHK